MATLAQAREPEMIFEAAVVRERSLSALVACYAITGLLFMLVPGTFVGLWNLFAISAQHGSNVSVAWVQAHGHAQIFGWIGSFILGIGFYSLPRATSKAKFPLWRGWTSWALWTLGVTMRWSVGVWDAHWRTMLVGGSILELVAFLLFFQAVSGHRPEGERKKLDTWIWVVIAGTIGYLILLMANAVVAVQLAAGADSPAVPRDVNIPLLTLATWGFLVPFVWGFSARWVTIFLGLRNPNGRLLLAACAVNAVGVASAWTSHVPCTALLLLTGTLMSIRALRIFEPSERPPKVHAVCRSFPVHVRIAYGWLLVAAALGMLAALVDQHNGLWGASRHALTVGFVSLMVLAIGQRVLPGFAGMKLLYSPRLMAASLSLLTVGCTLRVVSQSLAYEGVSQFMWKVLPVSAAIEMTAVTLFALNMGLTFASQAPHVNKPRRSKMQAGVA